MSRLQSTIGRKLGLAFALVSAIFVAAMVVVLLLNAKVESTWEQSLRWQKADAGAALQIRGTQQQMAAQALYVATGAPRYKAEWEAGVAMSDRGAKAVDALHDPVTAKIANSANAADHTHDATVHGKLFPAVASGNQAAALTALGIADQAVRVPLAAQLKIADYTDAQRSKIEQRATSAAELARTVGIAAIAAGVLLAALIAAIFARSVVRRLRRLREAATAISGGDVDQAVDDASADELGQLAGSFRGMVGSLGELADGFDRVAAGDLTVDIEPRSERDRLGLSFARMVEQLRGLIGAVAGSASTVSSSSQQVAVTSEEAGRAVTEIAGSVAEVAQGAERQVKLVGDTREDARATTVAADMARREAEEGAQSAQAASAAMATVRDSSAQVTTAIHGLADKSDQIGDIVATITAIAEQTNLLALNAAIEAARAGDQGRGFAVVADEVRKLAEESHQAAGTIAGLIAQIQTDTLATVTIVEESARRADETADSVEASREAFARITASVHDVAERIEQIAAAAGDVAAVAEQSSASVEEVSASTQETSASTQQIAASAQELARTAQELEQIVGRFTLTAA